MLSHSYTFTVPPTAIDANGHVNNVAYIQWMQDAAVAHATAVGCDVATAALNALWVVRRHEIEYRLPAFLNDTIEVKTWILDCRLVSSRRKYEFYRLPPNTQDSGLNTQDSGLTTQDSPKPILLARGQTDWVLLDAKTLHPIPIPPQIQSLYLPPTQPL